MSDWKSQKNEALIRRYYESNLQDTEALDLLCKKVHGLIRSVAKKTVLAYFCLNYEDYSDEYTAYTMNLLEDLENEGFVALCTEIRKKRYQEGQGKFSTYIYPCLQSAMHKYMRHYLGSLALTRAEIDFILQTKKRFYNEKMSVEEISKRSHKSKREVVEAIYYNMEATGYWDLMPTPGDDDDPLMPDEWFSELTDPSPQFEISYYHKVCLKLLFPLFLTLGEAERALLGHYFGVYGYHKQTLDDIALTEMLTVDGVLKAVDAAIRQLRKNYQESDLKIWVDAHKMVRHAIRDAGGGEDF